MRVKPSLCDHKVLGPNIGEILLKGDPVAALKVSHCRYFLHGTNDCFSTYFCCMQENGVAHTTDDLPV